MTPLIEIEGLEVTFRSWWPRRVTRAVDGVALSLHAGERVGLVGESGCGKSTLVKAVLGALAPSAGTVRLFGQPVRARVGRAHGPSPADIQAVFQSVDAHIDPTWTPAALMDETAHRFGRSSEEALATLARVGLSHRTEVPAGRLSGGERRRLGLARVLLVQPRVVLADEPCAGVDAGRRLDLVAGLAESIQPGGGLLLVSHDLHLVRHTCSRVLVMLAGRVVEACSTTDLGTVPHHPYTDTLLRAAGLREGDVPEHPTQPAPDGTDIHQ
ncbi:MAG: hypothetical protein CL927_05470 [Deltaproteobacteria bacterium]|nr:hypothetical protein [Deltaproteobacteria bacterium]HCH63198.1 hypothetical protein [Deltaproteobacteria bacterium]